MPLTDFFSHKIFSSDPGWENRLCAIAEVFNRFNGQCFVSCRDELIEEFKKVSSSISDRKGGEWRDEITAYVSHLGVARIMPQSGAWIIETTNTTREFLLGEAPDVGAFLRTQLPLFQFPNAMGITRMGRGNVQSNTLGKTWEYIQAGMHVSPVRLVAVALRADAELRGVELLDAEVFAKELYALANHPDTCPRALPDVEKVHDVLHSFREKEFSAPKRFETRFHLLNHTEVFKANGNRIKFREVAGEEDAKVVLAHFNAITSIAAEFTGFDDCKSKDELKKKILSGEWERYFDTINHISRNTLPLFTHRITVETLAEQEQLPALRKFKNGDKPYGEPTSPLAEARTLANPEITRIKRERRNVAHAVMVSRLMSWLQEHICAKEVGDSQHIDLWAILPGGQIFIFEVKSGGEGVLEQVRKGVSQLYEYRYRYSREKKEFKSARLCLVLPDEPAAPWMPGYLCEDRGINLCMLPIEKDETLPEFHKLSAESFELIG